MAGPNATCDRGGSGPAVDVIYATLDLPRSRNTTRYQHVMALARGFRLQVLLQKPLYPKELAAIADIRICPGGSTRFLGNLFYLVWALVRVAGSRYRARRADVNHRGLLLVTTYQPVCILAGALAKGALGVKWVADIFDVPALVLDIALHNGRPPVPGAYTILLPLLTEIAYRALKRTDLVLCTLVPDALARCAIAPGKLLALTNGVVLSDSFPTGAADRKRGEAFEVLYVGSVLRIRGLDTMLDACSLLRNRVPGLRLVLVGPSDPQEQEWLEERVAELGLEENVLFTGELPHGEALSRVHEADLCLFPFPKNYQTDFIYPVKIFEYMAAGKAVIASNLAGVRRIIQDGRSGILVDPSNPRALADAIYLLWKSPGFRTSLAANARAAMPRFEWNRINGQMLEALHPLTEDRR